MKSGSLDRSIWTGDAREMDRLESFRWRRGDIESHTSRRLSRMRCTEVSNGVDVWISVPRTSISESSRRKTMTTQSRPPSKNSRYRRLNGTRSWSASLRRSGTNKPCRCAYLA